MKHISLFLIVIILNIISINTVKGMNYYVNPASTELTQNGTFDFPWKSLSQVNLKASSFMPGDTIFFKRDQIFSGTLLCSKSGTHSNPIVYTAYGLGEKPTFTNTTSDIITITNQQYVVIDNIKIKDFTMDVADHSKTAKISYAIILNNSPNCSIQNCDISLVGVGIQVLIGSNFTKIINNNIYNLRIVRNTKGGDDDYGANAMVIGSSGNLIQYNIFEACWAYCYDYGHDGGAVEFFGQTMNDNIVMYNTAIDCDGFLEVGSNTGGTSINNVVAYNKVINCGLLGTFHNDSQFSVNIYNTKIFNNDIIETKFLFPNTLNLFWLGDYSKQSVVNLKNNILWVISGIDIVSSNVNPIFLMHDHNIYRQKNGDIGINLDPTELLLNDSMSNKLLMDTSGLPKYWDLHLKNQSPAIDFGINVGLINDFEGNLIVNNPDAGIYEYKRDSSSILNVILEADSILCHGDSTTVHVSVSNGLPPYTGIGNFEVVSGKHVFIVYDAIGKEGIATIYIGEPDELSISILQNIDTSPDGTTSVNITATGGKPPYQFKLGSSDYQTSNIFNQVPEGDYVISVKDVNNCIQSTSINVLDVVTSDVTNNKLQIRVSPNPSTSYFTLSPIKYKNKTYTMSVKVFSLSTGYLMFSTQTTSNNSVRFGSSFLPGNYLLVVEVAGTTQAIQLLKL